MSLRRVLIATTVVLALLWGAWEWCEQLTRLGRVAMPSRLARLRTDASMSPMNLPRPRPRSRRGLAAPTNMPAARSKDLLRDFVAAVPEEAPRTALEAANRFIESRKAQWNVQDYHELRPTVYESPVGAKVKYTVYQGNLPIIGMEIEVELGADKEIAAYENNYLPVKKADLMAPTVSANDTIERSQGRYSLDETSTAGVSSVLFLAPGSDDPEVAYVIPVKESGEGGQAGQILFRASDGQVLGKHVSRSEF